MNEGTTATKEMKGKDMSTPRNDVEESLLCVCG